MKGAGVVLAAGLAASPSLAAGWAEFYAPVEREAPTSASPEPWEEPTDDAGICLRAILEAQERHGIPGNLLLGIGLQEAGTRSAGWLTVWPWSVNAAGEGRMFETREAAMTWVRERQAAGIQSIDVGCMQINLRWHPDAFETLAEGFDPQLSADYAARFLRDLRERTGNWETAAGSYHSFTPERRAIYTSALRRNIAAANAQLDELRTLASLAPASPQVRVAADPLPLEGGFWSASLSEGTGAGQRSLYSREDLQPVLPDFRSVR